MQFENSGRYAFTGSETKPFLVNLYCVLNFCTCFLFLPFASPGLAHKGTGLQNISCVESPTRPEDYRTLVLRHCEQSRRTPKHQLCGMGDKSIGLRTIICAFTNQDCLHGVAGALLLHNLGEEW